MKPGAPESPAHEAPTDSSPGAVQRFLDGKASHDPFYLTNRTVAQKVRLGLLIAIPPALVVAGVVYAVANRSVHVAPPRQLTNAEIAARMLPNLNETIDLHSNPEVDVVDVVVQGGRQRITGTLRNKTDRVLSGVEVIFDLTNSKGSRLGAVNCKVDRIAAKSSVAFQTQITQQDAAYAIVREVRNQ
jgi:hypothetical protein